MHVPAIRLRVLGLFAILLLAFVASPAAPAGARTLDSAPAPPPAAVGDPISPGIWRLIGNEPTGPLDDLEPLKQLIGNATVVGLGETIHTSGGYYRMKHRLFRFLVERAGFRVFAFETPWTNAEQVADYVRTCNGDPVEAITGLFGVWQSTETADLVRWMCEWNRTHPKAKDKLVFTGFDIQQPEIDGPRLIGFLQRIGVAADSPWIAAVEACEAVTVDHYPTPVPETPHQQCLAGLGEIEAHLQRNARAIQRRTSKVDYQIALLRLVGLRAWENEAYNFTRSGADSYTARDEGMAYAFRTLRALRFPKAKVAIWAHNSHISRAPHPLNRGLPMGSFLAAALGESYFNVGLDAREVGTDWPGVACGWENIPGQGSVEAVLHGTGEDALLLDLDFPGAAEPLLTPGVVYELGARRMVPREHFDALVYVETSPAMTPTRWEPCQ